MTPAEGCSAEEINAEIAQAIREHGDVVLRGEAECILRRSRHPDDNQCPGCKSQLGCVKLFTVRWLNLKALQYPRKGIEDHFRTEEVLADLFLRIMDARTLEELAELRDHPFGQ
ncbi:MAG: hypothetical protein NTY11_02515 [Candidatus Parcubacteria bacterium]|nr:hypothetical protein [Candidatus Parcubacteria bacterium]